jgi:hypothetical protein
MQQAPAGTIGASEIGRKIVPSLAATEESRETDAADVSGGTRLHYCHWPPFRHRQVQLKACCMWDFIACTVL